MAVSANTVWEIRSTATANMVNGGGFVTGASGTDYSQQNAAQYALTGVTSAGAGNVILTASASADMVGNILKVVSGTNFTQSWFEITSVVAGVSITCSTNAAGTAICTGVGAAGVINIGGALSLNSTLDDDWHEEIIGGNFVWIKAGTYSLGESVAVASTSATSTNPIKFIGYNSTRGDEPMINSGNQPVIAAAANDYSSGINWKYSYITFTTTTANGIVLGASTTATQFSQAIRCKVTNTSTTTTRIALQLSGSCSALFCEAISQNGDAIRATSTHARVIGCYVHDSRGGINIQSNSALVSYNVVWRCYRRSVDLGASATGYNVAQNNTIIGYATPITGGQLGIYSASDNPRHIIINNIAVGHETGITKVAPVQNTTVIYRNLFFNNTANTSGVTLDSSNITGTNPGLAGVVELTGTTATTSGSVLTDSGANFSSVTPNVDYLYVVSGTGVTANASYLITAATATTLTVNNALGTSSAGDVIYSVGVGSNFIPGTNTSGVAYPSFYGPETTNSLDLGAVQRPEPMPSSTFVG